MDVRNILFIKKRFNFLFVPGHKLLHIIYVTGMRYFSIFPDMVNMCNLTIPFVKNALSDTSMHYNSFWEKISFLSRALKQKAIHGQEYYQTLNSGCNRHLMADVALPNHFCSAKDIKNIKDHKGT